MSNPLVVDLFAEDRAHEEWLRPLLERVAREENVSVRIRVRSARGGHGRVLSELKAYQQVLAKGIGGPMPNLLVAAIDANCSSFVEAQKKVQTCGYRPKGWEFSYPREAVVGPWAAALREDTAEETLALLREGSRIDGSYTLHGGEFPSLEVDFAARRERADKITY